MRKWIAFLCAVLLLIGCSAAEFASSAAAPSQAASQSVSIPDWMQEDYQPTGKYDFQVPEGTIVEYIMAVPDFLNAEQQARYVAAMEAYRAFTVEPGFSSDDTDVWETGLPYQYVREKAFEDSADLADYLRSLFDFELFKKLHQAYAPVESQSIAPGSAPLVGQSLYADFEGKLYVLQVGQGNGKQCPYPASFELISRTEQEIVFETCYESGAACTLRMTLTDRGWLFSAFSTPYDGQLSAFW
ncbi:hypothetical protein WMO24_09445 [Ruthenibacterium sp. CLA-JM-H11]|uniref:Uncharacterized protein n=1 Tax=Ruthenibacterium intestinale TaxID=3133163 RepID=A0ABV1GFR7_9FIRM